MADELRFNVTARVSTQGRLDYHKVDVMREAMMPVLRRHGYEIPGVADLCAIAALRAADDYDRKVMSVGVYLEPAD